MDELIVIPTRNDGDTIPPADVNDQMTNVLLIGGRVPAGLILPNVLNDDPAVIGVQLINLEGQVIEIASFPYLVENTYCGDANNATATAFYKTSDAGGTTRDTAGGYFVLDDTRGLVLRNPGNATINGRTKTGPTKHGEKTEDQMQLMTGDVATSIAITWNSAPKTDNGALNWSATTGAHSNAASTGSGHPLGIEFDSSNSPNARTSATTDGETRVSTTGATHSITY